jgi:methyl-accepting chemotaxis protein
MTFRRSAPAALIVAAVVVVAVSAVLSNRLFSGLTESVEASQFELMQSIFDSSLSGAEGRALARAEMIANLPTTRRLFAARDREGLVAEYGPMFDVQKEKYGVDQAQFHVPPATSFLRLHDPATHGDDLTNFRPMVVAIGKDHLARKGLAIARSGPAVFGIVPVLDDGGQYAGSFEFGIAFGSILDGLKASYGLEATLFIEEQPLREYAKGVSGEVLSEENRLGKYLKFHSTHWDLMQELVKSGDISTLEEPATYTRTALGVTYGVLLVPLRNTAGQPIGVMAIARDFSGSRAAASRSLVWQTTLALAAIVLLAGAILVVIRGFLLRPLAVIGQRFAALAEGDHEAKIEEPETLGEELQALAAHHERLRREAEAADAQSLPDPPEGRS